MFSPILCSGHHQAEKNLWDPKTQYSYYRTKVLAVTALTPPTLDFHKTTNATVSCACKGSRLCILYENLITAVLKSVRKLCSMKFVPSEEKVRDHWYTHKSQPSILKITALLSGSLQILNTCRWFAFQPSPLMANLKDIRNRCPRSPSLAEYIKRTQKKQALPENQPHLWAAGGRAKRHKPFPVIQCHLWTVGEENKQSTRSQALSVNRYHAWIAGGTARRQPLLGYGLGNKKSPCPTISDWLI